MSLLQTNQIWLDQCSKELGTTPEKFLNILLTLLQTELGLSEGNIKDWISTPKKIETELRGVLNELTATRVATEETVKSIQLYITQIQQRIGEGGERGGEGE